MSGFLVVTKNDKTFDILETSSAIDIEKAIEIHGFGDARETMTNLGFSDGFVKGYDILKFVQKWNKTFFLKRPPQKPENTPKNAGAKWSDTEELALLEMFRSKVSIRKMSEKLGRTEKAVRARLMKLEQIPNPFKKKYCYC